MAKIKRLIPKANTGAKDAVKLLAASLNKGNEITLDNAFVLAGQRKLGQPISNEDIENIARRTTDPDVATRLFTQFSGTNEVASYKVLMRLSIGLAMLYGEKANLINPVVPRTLMIAQTLAAFFVNRVCESPDNNVQMIVEVDAKASMKLAYMFDSFWSSLDIEKLRDQTYSSESKVNLSFRKVHLEKANSYSVYSGEKHCGNIFWDKGIDNPAEESNGWRVTLFDGFPSSIYPEGPLSNPHDPYIQVSKGELKLHNPQRLSLAEAKTWVRRAMK